MTETSCTKCKHYGVIAQSRGYWWCQIFKDVTNKHCQYFKEEVSAVTTRTDCESN